MWFFVVRRTRPVRRSLSIVVSATALIAGAVGLGGTLISPAGALPATGSGFTITPGDLAFILKQIKIAEHHAATFTPANPCGTLVGTGTDQIPDRLTAYGLRTVDGSCNNLFAGREKFAAADVPFPRLSTAVFRGAESAPAGLPVPVGNPDPSSYTQKKGNVFDSQPRVISNLIVDQTASNPAALASAANPVRTQGNPASAFPCGSPPPTNAAPGATCTPLGKTLFIPNVTTDVGLSPPYNSLFTFFGQFFDHGVDQTVKSGGTVFVPLRADDPLRTVGPDGIGPGNTPPNPPTGDEVPASEAFMVLTRAQNQPGPDGILGDDPATTNVDESADDVQNANNTDSPWVDQSQTYTSHSSHQVFLREYATVGGKPVSTGKLLGGLPAGQTYTGSPDGTTGMATWAAVKQQAAQKLGLALKDTDVTNIPMLAADPYGNFIPGPLRGMPQYVTKTGLVEGDTAHAVPVPANVLHFDTPFLTDIAHNADPGTVGPCTTPAVVDANNKITTPGIPAGCLDPDPGTTPSADFAHQKAGTYDDELLNAHFCAGDGRVNENIALTTIHQIFHSEHDRLVDNIEGVLTGDTSASGVAALAEWKLASGAGGWNGQRLFQAARFVTEMEYQHLVFEEFARKIQPAVRPFHVYSPDINPAIPAEFAHAVYRFGHSMLDDDVNRTNADGSTNNVPLLTAFLSPPEFFKNGTNAPYTPEGAAGAVVMGSSDQVGNELDEFVTETLRNNLLGLPLDLPTLNLTRARDAGIPPLNQVRRDIFAQTNDGQLAPYSSWSDFGQHLKHPESLINFVAAYGTHRTVRDSGVDGILGNGDDNLTIAGKRRAARAIVDPLPVADRTGPADTPPADAADFMFSTGAWANTTGGVTTTGLDSVDLWVGGLAEVTNLNGGLLGSTMNYVFQTTLEKLQDGDRLYYLNRTPGMNLRTQLEGNSFAELISRNTTGTNTLKADAFATADCKFQLANLGNSAAAFTAAGGSAGNGAVVADDPSTPDCDESLLLTRSPDGTISYKQRNTVDPAGINGQAVYNGDTGPNRVKGGNDNDTFWGSTGDDVIDGQGGDDIALGGDGNDIITDLDGADTLKGGPGNDAIDTGPGDDISMGGDGQDFMNGGANDNEAFAGPGNDFIIAGQGADAVFGDTGDDWIEGGSGQDLLQGDHGAPFFDDPAEAAPGNDVFIGQVGENDYDAEGGDDVMAQNAAIDRNAGAAGFDWAFHQYDTVGADDDMAINNNLGGLPIPVVVNRDRWQETEGDSGSDFNDTIHGDDFIPFNQGSTVPGVGVAGGFTGCDALDQAGLNRIPGLAAIVPLTSGTNAQDPGAAGVGHITGLTCPLSGAFWGGGNILLGGGGSDLLEGRGGDDIIDGDRALSVRISVRSGVTADAAGKEVPTATEIGSADLMESTYQTGNPKTLQQAVFDGTVNPGALVATRGVSIPPTAAGGTDTALFSGPRSNYTITPSTTDPTKITVVDNVGADGTDTLFNIEQLKFPNGDGTTFTIVPTAPLAVVTPTSLDFAAIPTGTTSAAKTVTLSDGGVRSLVVSGISIVGTDASQFALPASTATGACTSTSTVTNSGSCTINVTFKPTTAGAKSASLQIASNSNGGSPTLTLVPLTGTANPNGPVASLSPATAQAFGNQSVNVTSAGKTVTLTNTGNQQLTGISITLTGTGAGQFARTTSCGTTLAAAASCSIGTTFRPTSAGDKTAAIHVASNSVVPPPDITLTGTGLAGGIAVGALSPAPTTFSARRPALLRAGTTDTKTVTVSSTGPGSLVISSVAIGAAATNSAPNLYSQTNTCGTAPRAIGPPTCTITVKFTPTALGGGGARNATLNITSNAGAAPTVIQLVGNAA